MKFDNFVSEYVRASSMDSKDLIVKFVIARNAKYKILGTKGCQLQSSLPNIIYSVMLLE